MVLFSLSAAEAAGREPCGKWEYDMLGVNITGFH